jgi:hypothetical protein
MLNPPSQEERGAQALVCIWRTMSNGNTEGLGLGL